jgi:hypothetical protein
MIFKSVEQHLLHVHEIQMIYLAEENRFCNYNFLGLNEASRVKVHCNCLDEGTNRCILKNVTEITDYNRSFLYTL